MTEKLEIEFVITVTPVVKNNPGVKVVVDSIIFDQITVLGTVVSTTVPKTRKRTLKK